MHQEISLKATQADGFHYPDDWDPRQGSLDAFQRRRGFEHHFGKNRVKQLDKGILLIRFEMPFHVRCLKCEQRIAKGVRFNADKKQVGNYHSTKIWTFSMACTNCMNKIVIKTDPQNSEYICEEGIRKCADTWSAKDTETIELRDSETRAKMQVDPMFRLEQTAETSEDKARGKAVKERLADLKDFQVERKDAYDLNSRARGIFRTRKKEIQKEEEEAAKKKHFAIPLLETSEEDRQEAKRVKRSFVTDPFANNLALKRQRIASSSIFGTPSGNELADLAVKRKKLDLARKVK
jgi:coiled-coil domain-containing protein 130